jgi:hypothetical protein
MTVTEIRKAYTTGGLEATLDRKSPERVYPRRLDGDGEAHLIALACGEPPDGYERWSLRLLKKRFIQLGYVENVSYETVRTTLKKRNKAVADRTVVHPAEVQCGVCLLHGRCVGCLQTALRSEPPPDLHG